MSWPEALMFSVLVLSSFGFLAFVVWCGVKAGG